MTPFAYVVHGRNQGYPNTNIPRHRHDQAYAAIVLAGGYEECGSCGRFRVGPGDVLLHGRFDAHWDRFGARGAHILNLLIRDDPEWHLARVADADALVRTAQTDPAAACLLLKEQIVVVETQPGDWPDLLAADLRADPVLCLGAWARTHGLAAETVSRGFRKAFGLTPAQFRVEARTRWALTTIMNGAEPLAAVAAATGFADQAHMSRTTKALTGETPAVWRRRSNAFKTDRARLG